MTDPGPNGPKPQRRRQATSASRSAAVPTPADAPQRHEPRPSSDRLKQSFDTVRRSLEAVNGNAPPGPVSDRRQLPRPGPDRRATPRPVTHVPIGSYGPVGSDPDPAYLYGGPELRAAPGNAEQLPYVTVGRSALIHRRLVVCVAAAGLLVGLAFGVVRPPVYTADARLVVGQGVNITDPSAVAGLAPAEASLASDYSRLVSTQSVIADVGTQLGHPATLGGSLSASPIPESDIIRVDGSAGSAAVAEALTNAGAKALVTEVNDIINANSKALDTDLSEYRSFESQITEDTQQEAADSALITAGAKNKVALQNQVTALKSDIDALQLQATAVEQDYTTQYSPVQAEEEVLRVSSPAVPTGSDKSQFLEIGVAAGLLGGALVGIAIAAVIEMLPTLRRRIQPH